MSLIKNTACTCLTQLPEPREHPGDPAGERAGGHPDPREPERPQEQRDERPDRRRQRERDSRQPGEEEKRNTKFIIKRVLI